MNTLERIGLIVAGAGLGAKILAGTGLWVWALVLGALAALGGYLYKRFDS